MHRIFGLLAALPLLIIWFVLIGLSIYLLILLIKLAHRGIKALDIYIAKNTSVNYTNQQPNENNM